MNRMSELKKEIILEWKCVPGFNLFLTSGDRIYQYSQDYKFIANTSHSDGIMFTYYMGGNNLLATYRDHTFSIIDIYKGEKKELFPGFPTGICRDSEGQIIVSNGSYCIIGTFSKDGQYIGWFDTKASQVVQPGNLLGICVDQWDNILVADYSRNRVSIFTHSGVPIQEIIIQKPWNVAVFDRKILIKSDIALYLFSN